MVTLIPFSVNARFRNVAVAALGFLLLPSAGALAQTWNGSRTSYWNNPLNWSGNALPANDGTADLVFAQVVDPSKPKGVCYLDANWSVHSLTFNAVFRPSPTGTSWLYTATPGPYSLTVTGGVANTTGGTLNLAPGFVLGAAVAWSDTGGTTAVNGQLSGPGGIVKTGSGMLWLPRTDNTFAGGVSVLGGTLAVIDDGSLGAPANGVSLNGGALRFGAETVNYGAQARTTQRPITVGASGGALQYRAGTLTLNGTISGSGAVTFAHEPGWTTYDPIRFLLGRTNPYAGDTAILGATVIAPGPGAVLGGGDVVLQPGGVLSLAAADNLAAGRRVVLCPQRARVLRDAARDPVALLAPARTTGGILALLADQSVALDFATLGNGQLFLGAATDAHYTAATLGPGAGGVYRLGGGVVDPAAGGVSPRLTIAGHDNVLTGAAAALVGPAVYLPSDQANADLLSDTTVVLANANNHTGGTTLRSGTLIVGADGALGSGPLTLTVGRFGTLDARPRTLPQPVIFNGGTGGIGLTLAGPAALTFTGPVDLAGGQPFLRGNYGAPSITFAGPISNGALYLSGGTWLLSAVNSFAGGLTVDGYTLLRFYDDTNLGAPGAKLTLYGGTLQPADDAPAALTISRPLRSAIDTSEVRVGAGKTLTLTSALSDAGGTNGAQFTKSGAGTLRLTGDTTGAYANVKEGVLRIQNAFTHGGTRTLQVVVKAGGTLTGGSELDRIDVSEGGWLAPGAEDAPGLFWVSYKLRLIYGCTLALRLGTTAADSLVAGPYAYFEVFPYVQSPAIYVAIADAGGLAPGQTYTLLDWSSATSYEQPTAASFRLASGPVGGTLAIVNKTLQLTTRALTPYEAWQNRYFPNRALPAAAPGALSPAGDGLTNLLKYALGLDPLRSGVAGLPRAGVLPGFVTLTYTRAWAASDVTFTPQWSDDLAVWHNEDVAEETLADDGVALTVRARVAAGSGGRRFVRLQVTQR